MPRDINRKCQNCAIQWATANAEGRDCWVKETCRSRRSYYRNRSKRLAQMAASYEPKRRQPVEIDIPLPGRQRSTMTAQWVQYGPDDKVHALSAQVFDGSELIATVKPIHTFGVPQGQLRRWTQQTRDLIRLQYGAEFRGSIREPRELCPLCREADHHDELG